MKTLLGVEEAESEDTGDELVARKRNSLLKAMSEI
jgi:hypothetical protein